MDPLDLKGEVTRERRELTKDIWSAGDSPSTEGDAKELAVWVMDDVLNRGGFNMLGT